MCVMGVRVDFALGKESLRQVHLGPNVRDTLLAAKQEAHPVVLIVNEDDMEVIRQCEDILVDRGAKPGSKGLAIRFLDCERIPYVRYDYATAGTVRSSVRAFLENPATQAEHGVYLLVQSPSMMADVLTGTEPVEPSGNGRGAGSVSKADASDALRWLNAIDEQPVPAVLRGAFLGSSPEACLVRQLILLAAGVDDPVLIVGPMGTGKELVAEFIHRLSDRSRHAFIAVNCAAIPHDLFESVIFGHVKGAFTGAVRDSMGKWREAHHGTLMLDEIGDLAPSHQAKLLRAVEYNEITPLGAVGTIRVNTRVIAATNRDLKRMIRRGEFREDLYQRLCIMQIDTPPLRIRLSDLNELANAIWRRIHNDEKAQLAPTVVEVLAERSWHGNVRELEAVLKSLRATFPTRQIGPEEVEFAASRFDWASGEEPAAEEEDLDHGRLMLKHLYRTDVANRATQLPMRDVMSGKNRTPAEFKRIEALTHEHLEKLEGLCTRPMLYGRPHTYDAERYLKHHLRAFVETLPVDPANALTYWKEVLDPAFDKACAALMEESDRIWKNL